MMWDFSGNNSQRHPQRSPSPAMFPVPQLSQTPSFAPSSYPGNAPFVTAQPFPRSPSPHIYSSQYQSVPRGQIQYQQPPPQVVIIRSHKHRRHRHHSHSHSHSHSQPVAIPQPVSYSTPHLPLHPTTYSAADHPGPHRPSRLSPQIIPPPQYQHHSHSQTLQLPNPPTSGSFQYSRCTGKKKALCIGINYHGQDHELRGCINDAKAVSRFLMSKYGYKSEDIVLLTDDASNPRQLPTRQNILDAMRWLVRGARAHDSLFFHYSGHGGQVEDLDADEVDGFDEVIFPVDYHRNGYILDDDMHAIMAAPVPVGCRLTTLFDSCHSGTVLDLPYIYSSHGRLKGEHVRGLARKRKETCGDVISWSACKDGQTSADTFHEGVAVGAMSHAFIQSLTNKPKQSYRELLRSVRLILQPRYSQTPQLGSSHHIDTSLEFVI